jgi:DNA-binding transcriptional regulator YdaS (Cro superfamily)
MNLKEYFSKLDRGEATRLAKEVEVSISFLSQIASGSSKAPIKCCLRIEKATGGQVTRQDLRPFDAHEIWPDLPAPQITQEPVPSIPEELLAFLPQLKNCGRLKDDRAIAQFLKLPPATRSEVFNTTPPNQLITEAICLKAKQALARGPQ